MTDDAAAPKPARAEVTSEWLAENRARHRAYEEQRRRHMREWLRCQVAANREIHAVRGEWNRPGAESVCQAARRGRPAERRPSITAARTCRTRWAP